MCTRHLVTTIAALCLVAVRGDAQLTPGERVRIVHGSTHNLTTREGAFLAVTADSILLRDDSTSATIALSRDSVFQVEHQVRVGHRALRGAGIGTLAGVVAGASAGALSTPCPQSGECWKGLAALVGGIGGAAVGLVTGTIGGFAVGHYEWQYVALPPRSR